MYICSTVVFYKNEHFDSVCITWWECDVKMLTQNLKPPYFKMYSTIAFQDISLYV